MSVHPPFDYYKKTEIMSYNGEMKKRYTAAIKVQIVTELLKEEKTLAQLSSEYGVSTTQLTRWKNYVLAEMPRLFETKNDQSQEKYDQIKWTLLSKHTLSRLMSGSFL